MNEMPEGMKKEMKEEMKKEMKEDSEKGTREEDSERGTRKALRFLVILTVVLYALLTIVGLFGFFFIQGQRHELERVATTTLNALCALHQDIEERLENSKQFLKDHPDGIPGISVEEIQRGIDAQERTLNALSPLLCEEHNHVVSDTQAEIVRGV